MRDHARRAAIPPQRDHVYRPGGIEFVGRVQPVELHGAQGHHAAAIAAPARFGPIGALRPQRVGRAALGRNGPHAAARFRAQAHESQALPIGRPGGLERIAGKQCARGATGAVGEIERAQRGKGNGLAIRRQRRAFGQMAAHRGAVFDALLHAAWRGEREVDRCRERDRGLHAAGQVDPHETAALGQDQRAAIGGKAISGGEVVVIAAFLPIVVDRPGNPAVFARGQVAQAQAGLAGGGRGAIAPRGIGQQPAIGRKHRPHAARHHGFHRACSQILPHDGPDGRVLLGPGVAALGGIPHRLAIGRRRCSQGIDALVPAFVAAGLRLDQHLRRAAVERHAPQLECEDGMDRAADIDAAAIGRPCR